MPQIGEIKKGNEIGYKNCSGIFIWHACINCGKERWVQFIKSMPERLKCQRCGHLIKSLPKQQGTIQEPIVGDMRYGEEIGKIGRHKFMWAKCIGCGQTRWVQFKNGKIEHLRCNSCNLHLKGEKHPCYKGGKTKSHGYINIHLYPGDFFYSMARKCGMVFEHRLVMAKYLNRCLLPWEVVHHKNGIKDDNRLENLVLFPSQSHHGPDALLKQTVKRLQQRIKQLEERVTLLEAENILLKETERRL